MTDIVNVSNSRRKSILIRAKTSLWGLEHLVDALPFPAQIF